MESFILVLNIIFAILLVISVLLQKSEGGALGLGASQESFVSSRSAGNFLTKVTAILAALFITSSVFLTVISNQGLSNISVIEKVEEKTDPNEPEIPKSDQE